MSTGHNHKWALILLSCPQKFNLLMSTGVILLSCPQKTKHKTKEERLRTDQISASRIEFINALAHTSESARKIPLTHWNSINF